MGLNKDMGDGIRILGLATCFNRKDKTVNSINGLINYNPNITFDFIITDDNSKDGTAEAIAQIPGVTVMHGDGNSFYTGGMRIAMAEGIRRMSEEKYCCDYVMLFNDDVDFYAHAIERLVSKKESVCQDGTADSAVLVGACAESDEKTLAYGGVVRKSNFRPKFKIIMSDCKEGTKVDTFNANCVLIPQSLFVKTGIMDKVYHHSLGDFDYGYMLKKNGGISFVFDEFVGVCPNNSEKGTWRDASLSRKARFKAKESIKGVPFGEFFHYLLKNYNILTAIIYSISPYIRIILGI